MYKMNVALSSLVRGTCQQLLEPLNLLGRTTGGNVLRTLYSSSVRFQEPQVKSQELPSSMNLPKSSKDFSTHIQVTDSKGQSLTRTSCGTEGFRNIKKSTPIAAQTTGISAAAKAQAKGVKFVRVLVKGLGPGRLSAIKGLTMGGLEIVSITDNTPVPHNGCRPRKARRM
ncbi:28S ribosomal protein S11, mitochondrial [Bagarius yarrelli]|uniref:28S ribosomal protein S11, mitochondrial n=1 Tax=Bagarius yarrelli TaxID=175774 RepID=A0A556U0M6_BAGYA|nr:28S ribosomal protein S11, mitochondrial [Bagarius yarrelli]